MEPSGTWIYLTMVSLHINPIFGHHQYTTSVSTFSFLFKKGLSSLSLSTLSAWIRPKRHCTVCKLHTLGTALVWSTPPIPTPWSKRTEIRKEGKMPRKDGWMIEGAKEGTEERAKKETSKGTKKETEWKEQRKDQRKGTEKGTLKGYEER